MYLASGQFVISYGLVCTGISHEGQRWRAEGSAKFDQAARLGIKEARNHGRPHMLHIFTHILQP